MMIFDCNKQRTKQFMVSINHRVDDIDFCYDGMRMDDTGFLFH